MGGGMFGGIAFGQYAAVGTFSIIPTSYDEVTAAPAYFRRFVTGKDADFALEVTAADSALRSTVAGGDGAFAREFTGRDAAFRRTVTGTDTER